MVAAQVIHISSHEKLTNQQTSKQTNSAISTEMSDNTLCFLFGFPSRLCALLAAVFLLSMSIILLISFLRKKSNYRTFDQLIITRLIV